MGRGVFHVGWAVEPGQWKEVTCHTVVECLDESEDLLGVLSARMACLCFCVYDTCAWERIHWSGSAVCGNVNTSTN